MDDFTLKDKFDQKNREIYIKKLMDNYNFIKCEILGESLCNRNIHCLTIGTSANSALFVGAFHGMEWLTSLLLLKFLDNLCKKIKNSENICQINPKKSIAKKGLTIIPCINPDGVEISINGAKSCKKYTNFISSITNDTTKWQANARGVDLNHNFCANWDSLHELEQKSGIIGPAPTRYGGPFCESEPETKILTNCCTNHNFRHVVAFHSQGEEIYWTFGNNTSQKSKLIAKTMAKLSNYKLSEPKGLAVGGGFKDWFITRFQKPGFTVEIGKGKNPLPITDIDKIYNQLEKMLLFCSIV